jgi:hypothetical protein
VRTYKIRKFSNGNKKQFTNYSLTIPSAIAKELPKDMTFVCELTEEGILFRPSLPEEEAVTLPSWADNNGKPKSRKRPGTQE